MAVRPAWPGLVPAPLREPRYLRLLALLAAASFFEGYDLNLIMIILPAIRHSLGLSQARAADWLGLVYLGSLPALVLARRADRVGRRRLLLGSMAGFTVATAATAAAPGVVALGLCQLCAQAFLTLDVTLTWTVLAEELPAAVRGYGFGVLAMLEALGAGAAALAWGLVLSPQQLSWRWMYALATPVLLAVVIMRRRLPESSRFQAAAVAGRLSDSWRAILRPPHRRLLVLLGAAAVLGNLLTDASVFAIDFMQTQRHLPASTADLILVGAGAVAIPVLIGAGGASDRLGRKRIGCTSLAASVAGTLCFFFLARGPAELFGALALTYVGQFGAWPTLRGFTAELFPTSQRALAGTAVGIATVAGQSTSFLLAGVLTGVTGSMSRSIAVLAAGPLLALVLVAARYPETAGRELEQTSTGPDGADPAGPGVASATAGDSGQQAVNRRGRSSPWQ